MDRGEKKDKTPPDVLMGSLSSRAGLEPAPPGSDPSNYLYSIFVYAVRMEWSRGSYICGPIRSICGNVRRIPTA